MAFEVPIAAIAIAILVSFATIGWFFPSLKGAFAGRERQQIRVRTTVSGFDCEIDRGSFFGTFHTVAMNPHYLTVTTRDHFLASGREEQIPLAKIVRITVEDAVRGAELVIACKDRVLRIDAGGHSVGVLWRLAYLIGENSGDRIAMEAPPKELLDLGPKE